MQSPIQTINRESFSKKDSKCYKNTTTAATVTATATSKSSSSSSCVLPRGKESKFHVFSPLQRTASLFGETSTTSSSTRSSEIEEVSAQRIRARYFSKLGIEKPPQMIPGKSEVSASISGGARTGAMAVAHKFSSIKTHVQRNSYGVSKSSYTELLKDDLGQTDMNLTMYSVPQHSKYNKGSKVAFKTDVRVHLIPHRNQYSVKEKEQLWMPPHELELMAHRNCIEFTVEQWDWRQAIEESDFVLMQGTLTHPAHAIILQQQQLQKQHQQQQRYTPSRQFCMIFSAQQQQSRRNHNYKPEYHQYSSSSSYSSSHLSTRYR